MAAKVNKSNSTAGAVRIEENLPETSTTIAQFVLQKHKKKMSDFDKNEGQGYGAQRP